MHITFSCMYALLNTCACSLHTHTLTLMVLICWTVIHRLPPHTTTHARTRIVNFLKQCWIQYLQQHIPTTAQVKWHIFRLDLFVIERCMRMHILTSPKTCIYKQTCYDTVTRAERCMNIGAALPFYHATMPSPEDIAKHRHDDAQSRHRSAAGTGRASLITDSEITKDALQYLSRVSTSHADVCELWDSTLRTAKKLMVLKRPTRAFKSVKPTIMYFANRSSATTASLVYRIYMQNPFCRAQLSPAMGPAFGAVSFRELWPAVLFCVFVVCRIFSSAWIWPV